MFAVHLLIQLHFIKGTFKSCVATTPHNSELDLVCCVIISCPVLSIRLCMVLGKDANQLKIKNLLNFKMPRTAVTGIEALNCEAA